MNIATVEELDEAYTSRLINNTDNLYIKFRNKREGCYILAEWIVNKMTTISNIAFIFFTKRENYNDNNLIKIIKEKMENHNDKVNINLKSRILLENNSAMEWSTLPLQTTTGIGCPAGSEKLVFIFESGITNEKIFSAEEEIVKPLSETFPSNVIIIN
jgi:hypothetical protein